MSLDKNPPGFRLPVSIPGAPEFVTYQELVNSAGELLSVSFDIFRQREGVYREEARRATWWRYWLAVGTATVVITAFTLAEALLVGDLFPVLLASLFSIPISIVSVYIGCYASFYRAQRQRSTVSQLEHSYVLAIAWLFGAVLSRLLIAFLGASGVLVALGVTIYTLAVMVNGLRMLYRFKTGELWLLAIVMWLVTGLSSAFLGSVFVI